MLGAAQPHLSLLWLALVVRCSNKSGPGVLQALKPWLCSSCLKDQDCPSLFKLLMSKPSVWVQEGGRVGSGPKSKASTEFVC